MVRLVCFDVDNTLLRRDESSVSDEVIKMIQQLISKGILVSIASGRPLADLIKLFSEVISDIVVVCYDGSLSIYKNNIVINHPIQKDLLLSFIDSVRNGGVYEYVAFGAGCAYVHSDFSKNAVISMEKAGTMEKQIVSISDFYKIDEPIYKVSAYIKQADGSYIYDYDYFTDEWNNYMKNVYIGNGWCEFISKDMDKGSAIEILCEMFSIASNEVMAFGDGLNDVHMLSFAGHSFAVNATCDEVKHAAKYETANVVKTVRSFFNI